MGGNTIKEGKWSEVKGGKGVATGKGVKGCGVHAEEAKEEWEEEKRERVGSANKRGELSEGIRSVEEVREWRERRMGRGRQYGQ